MAVGRNRGLVTGDHGVNWDTGAGTVGLHRR